MRFSIGRKIAPAPGTRTSPFLPGKRALVANAARAVVRNVGAAVQGNAPAADQAEIERRLATCRACELYVPGKDDAAAGRCGHEKCGCYLKFKTWLRAESCPAGKW